MEFLPVRPAPNLAVSAYQKATYDDYVAGALLRIRPAPIGRYLGWTLVAALLVFAGANLLIRGPIDVSGNFNLCDFANHYASARMWLIGGNPYDRTALPVVWQASGPGAVRTLMEEWYGLLPPGAFVIFAPVAAMPAGIAIAMWLLLSVACIAVCLLSVLSFTHLRAGSLKGMFLISGSLAAAPFQTLAAVGQVSLPAIAMLLLAIWCSQRGRDAWAGLLIGAAAALKPQLAAPFALFFLLYRNWNLVGFAAITCIVLNLIGIAQLEWRNQPWWTDWIANVVESTSPGRANDAGLAAPLRHHLVNLMVLIHSVVHLDWIVALFNGIIALLLVGAYAWLVRRARLTADSLLSLSILAALTLLPVYHRSYDAGILLLAYAWALTSLRSPLRRAAWTTIAALSVFLVPFDTLILLERKLGMFKDESETWIWQALVSPHHAWAALAVCLCLIGALHARVRQLTSGEPRDDGPEIVRLYADQRADETILRWRETRKTG